MLIEAGSEYINYYNKTKESYLSLLLPTEFITLKKNILDINNPLAEFINDTYVITSDKTDKGSKEKIFDAKQASENADLIKKIHNKIRLVIPILNKMGIEYIKNGRSKASVKQGIFIISKLKKVNTGL